MKKSGFLGLVPIMIAASLLHGQFPNTSTHWDRAIIKHDSQLTGATLTAVDARPLDQAVEALREEYGWLLDYEDPVYSAADLRPTTDQDWPPNIKPTPGLRIIAGGSFTTTYPEQADMGTDQARLSVLQQVLADYLNSGNPGKFRLVQTGPSRFAIVGTNKSSPPVLDTVVSVNIQDNALVALHDVLQVVKAKTGHTVDVGWVWPINPLHRCNVSQNFEEVPARTVLLSILDSCHLNLPLQWRFLYDPDTDIYALNLVWGVPVSPPLKSPSR
jgi:hypothetical protein